VLPDAEPQVSDIGQHMTLGRLDDLESRGYGIVLGTELARSLGVFLGDKVTMVVPQAQVTPAGILPRLRRFTVVGIFEVGMNEYDHGLALIHIEDAARLRRLEENVTGVRLKLDDMFLAPTVAREVALSLDGLHFVNDWTRRHANFFRALQLEKRMMFIILFLIVAVAAFNIVSTLVMVVTDKQSDIAILRTIGLAPGSVMMIFIVQGMVIGVIGTVFGVVGGIALALNLERIVPAIEDLFGAKLFPQDVYYINQLPSDMHWNDVSVISVLAFVLTLFSTLYPAWRASRTQPAEALRYE
jgi:lipoprotein-releasing system permease protein